MTTQLTVSDPWEVADSAQYDPTFTTYGQCDISIYFCVLQKGVGKVAFDLAQHELDDRRTAIEIAILPVQGGRQTIQRDMLAESQEWKKIVNPSIKKLGPTWNVRQLNDQYVEVQLVPSGRKYTHRETGETRDATTLRFVRVFQNEADCAAAAEARFGTARSGADRPLPEDDTPSAPRPAGTDLHERTTMARFLPTYWESCGQDVDKFLTLIAANPQLARHFSATSPEVVQLVGADAVPF